MAVRRRTYRPYSGPLTPVSARFLVPFRYALRNLIKSRLVAVYVVACLLVALVFASVIYVSHSAALLALFHIGPRDASSLVDGRFFFHFIQVELILAFILTAFAGPGLISPDLTNQALVLYLCRPFSRAEYVLGKFSVLAVLLSVITWIPGLILFVIQADLAGSDWGWENLWIARSIFLGSVIIILVYSALALALSAWFKRKLVAGGALLGVFFVGAGLGQTINAVLGTHAGVLLELGRLIGKVELSLFRQPADLGISPETAWIALLAVCVFCVYLLEHRIRAREVVRS
ncbi:MAG: ABC transporter permease [Terriglobia bacterium]